jgi:hypothetical protein
LYRISNIGYVIGIRLLELITYKEKSTKREIKISEILTFISCTVWKYLFGKTSDSLEKSKDVDDKCKK